MLLPPHDRMVDSPAERIESARKIKKVTFFKKEFGITGPHFFSDRDSSLSFSSFRGSPKANDTMHPLPVASKRKEAADCVASNPFDITQRFILTIRLYYSSDCSSRCTAAVFFSRCSRCYGYRSPEAILALLPATLYRDEQMKRKHHPSNGILVDSVFALRDANTSKCLMTNSPRTRTPPPFWR